MRKLRLIAFIIFGILFTVTSCKKTENAEVHEHEGGDKTSLAIDTTKFDDFFAKYPDYKPYRGEISKLYQKHKHYIWHEKKGLIEFAEVMYNRVNQIDDEGVATKIPYKKQLDELFENNGRGERPDVDSELLISSMYFFYAKNVLNGVDTSKSKETGWYLPRERTDYVAYLDTLMQDPKLLKKDTGELFTGYYNLKKGLKKYRDIEKKGGWGTITLLTVLSRLKRGMIILLLPNFVRAFLQKVTWQATLKKHSLTANLKMLLRHMRKTISVNLMAKWARP